MNQLSSKNPSIIENILENLIKELNESYNDLNIQELIIELF
jgi:hypothetical protein